jgi:CBS domain-containing protein
MTGPREPVRRVMSVGAVAVDEKVTLRSLAGVLSELDLGVALVAGPGGRAAIVSERDIVSALADGAEPDEVWVADVMSDPLVIADPDEPLIDVASRMCEEGVRHIAVVESGGVVGVVSARDALEAFVEYLHSDA